MHFLVAICLLASLVLQQEVVLGGDDVYFIYGSPGSRRGAAGLYGGNFKPNELPSNLNLEQTHIYRAEVGNSYLTGLSVTGLSYDPISKKLLMVSRSSLDNYLAKIDPCINKRLESEDFYFYRSDVHAGPFALYNSDVYFVAEAWRLKDRSVILTLTVRKMTGCPNGSTFLTRDGYDNRNCSVEVARILEEVVSTHESMTLDSAKSIAGYVRTVGSTLSVVKYGNKLHFLVQVVKPLYHTRHLTRKYSLRLYEAAEGRESRLLYVTQLPLKWANHIISSLGDISYKDGLLCWSAFESVFCGKWNVVGNVSEVHEVIKPGDAARVCQVLSGRYQDYRNLVTGIAVASAEDKINIIFGCWASWIENGGAGYLTANKDWSNIQMKNISDSGGRIRAGSLAIIDACPRPSRREVEFGLDTFW